MNMPLGSLCKCSFGAMHSEMDAEVYALSTVYSDDQGRWQIVGDMDGDIFVVESRWLHLVKTRAAALKQAERQIEEDMLAYEHHYYN